MALAFDTLAYARKLKSAGFPEDQAEGQAEALAAVVGETLATKQDLRDLAHATKQDLRELEYRMTFRLGAMMTVAVGTAAALAKLL